MNFPLPHLTTKAYDYVYIDITEHIGSSADWIAGGSNDYVPYILQHGYEMSYCVVYIRIYGILCIHVSRNISYYDILWVYTSTYIINHNSYMIYPHMEHNIGTGTLQQVDCPNLSPFTATRVPVHRCVRSFPVNQMSET